MNNEKPLTASPTCPVVVDMQTGARLHAGIFSDHRAGGRRFQGFGIIIDRPGFEWTVALSARDAHEIKFVEAAALLDDSERLEIRERMLELLDRLAELNPESNRHYLEFQIRGTIPRHAGLGSGTQLALAVGRSWDLFHPPERDVTELSQMLGRGRRSCVGTFGFARGGLLIDRGISDAEPIGSCRFSAPLPSEYCFLLVTPYELRGLAGTCEREAFRRLPVIADRHIERLEALLAAIPNSLADFAAFSEILREFGLLVGETFAPIQGGRLMHSRCEQIFSAFEACGLRGIAQSSWGPTMFAVCRDHEQALWAKQRLDQNLENVTIRFARPKHGAVPPLTTKVSDDRGARDLRR